MTDKYQGLRDALGSCVAEDWTYGAHSTGRRGLEVKRCNGILRVCADVVKMDAQYIAAANPSVISDLLRERDTLRAALLEIAAITTLEDGGFSDDAAAEIQGIVRRALI